MSSFTKLLSAGPLFFLSAWLLMIFVGIESTDLGVKPFGYRSAMVATIGLWLVLAPAVNAVARATRQK